MLENRKRLTIALILNLLILMFELYAFSMNFFVGNDRFDFFELQFYTHLSNIFMLFSSLMSSLEITKEFCGAVERVHRGVRRISYISTCCLTLTFVIVVSVLAPMEGRDGAKFLLFGSTNIFEHIICPILAFVTLVFFGDFGDLRSIDAFYAVIPTLLYAVVMIVLNVIGVVDGPYPFLRVREQHLVDSVLWFILLGAVVFGIAELLLFLTRTFNVSRKYFK